MNGSKSIIVNYKQWCVGKHITTCSTKKERKRRKTGWKENKERKGGRREERKEGRKEKEEREKRKKGMKEKNKMEKMKKKRKEKFWFVVFANSCGIKTLNMAYFKLPRRRYCM